MVSYQRGQAGFIAERRKKMGYLEVRDTIYLRMASPLKDALTITASYGGSDYPERSTANATASIPSPSGNLPRCMLVGRNPTTGGPSFLSGRREIGDLVHTAMVAYEYADTRASEPRLPKILASLNVALDNVGLPDITDEMPPIDTMALFPSPLMSRLAGLLVFGVDPHGAYCAVTNVSLNQVHVAITPSFVDFASICFISAGTSWRL